MLTTIRRSISKFLRKSRSVNNKPLNSVSLIVIIFIDLFILFNVFSGLDNISQWHLNPSQTYPCMSDWKNYRNSKDLTDRDYNILASALDSDPGSKRFQQANLAAEKDRLGKVSPICLNYAELKDKISIPEYRNIQQRINEKKSKIYSLEQANNKIRSQYDSTLLERIAGQGSNQSINTVSAEKAKQTLFQNKTSIIALNAEILALKDNLLKKPGSINLISLIKNESKYRLLSQGYQHSSFWYPSIQLAFQALFLIPLITIALTVHRLALSKGAGLVALISWHLLVIFFIPLLFKVFEFFQIGAIFKLFLSIITQIFGGLLFLVSYLYIFLIPVVGFSIIKISQKFAPNSKIQDTISLRFQQQLCLHCLKKIRLQDAYCPHCGYDCYVECQSCHELTYKHLSYCKQCGSRQDSIVSLSDRLPPDRLL